MAGTAPAPLAGTESVRFISQAVDATLRRGDDGAYRVDAEGSVRLHNTDRFNDAAITLGWPGWPGGDLTFDPAQLPGFAPRKGDAPLATSLQPRVTVWGGEQRDSSWLVAQTTIARDTRERLFFNWSQGLGAGPLLRYSFGLVPAGAWAGPVGSARVTLTLPQVSSAEMVVAAEPSDFTFSGRAVEWLLVEAEPTANPTVTLIAPHLWQEIEAARAAVATDPLNANLRLADLYTQLAAAGVARYAAEAEATLEAARRAAPDNPEPLRRLAALLRARATPDGGDLAALEQAATLGEAALAAGSADADLRAAVVADLETLATAWAEPDPALALDFLARAGTLSGDPARFAAPRRALAEQLSVAALARDDLPGALALAQQHGLPTDVAPFPWLAAAALRVENGPEERVVTLFAAGDEAALTGRLGALAERLAASGFPATWEANTLTIRFQGDEVAWASGGRAVAAALGAEPEWDLLRGALQPATLQYRTATDALAVRYGFREQVAVETGARARAAQLRRDAEGRASAWEQALLRAAADRWQALADSEEFTIAARFQAGGREVRRDWPLALPARETVEWRGDAPRRDRWLLAGAGGALALLVALALVWLPGRRR